MRSGQIAESRIDESARRLLRDKFRLGLFDNPYVDPDAAEGVVGSAPFRAAGEQAQRKSIVLLKNGTEPASRTLPLAAGPRSMSKTSLPEVAAGYGEVVQTPDEADLAILRLKAPYQQREGNFLERMFHAGDLDFKSRKRAASWVSWRGCRRSWISTWIARR